MRTTSESKRDASFILNKVLRTWTCF